MRRWVMPMVYAMIVFNVLVIFTSCKKSDMVLEEGQYYIFYVNKDGNGIEGVIYDFDTPKEKTSDMVSEMLFTLSSVGENYKAQNPIDSKCSVLDFQINEKQLTLYFDSVYLSMGAVDEVMHRAAIVKTLTQIEGINEVQFIVDGQPLIVNKKSVGFMKGQDFIRSIAGSSVIKTITVSLYFANAKGDKLVEVPTDITYDATMPIGKLMLGELLKGPESVGGLKEEGLQRTLGERVECNSLTIRDNICYVDFNKKFEDFLPGLKGEVVIYSVVNLLSGLPNVNKVQFTVEGEYIENLGGSLVMNLPFERDLDIVVSQDKDSNVKTK